MRELVAAGAEVTLAASPRLVSLLDRALPGVRVIEDQAWGDDGFDFHAPVGGSFATSGPRATPFLSTIASWCRIGPGHAVDAERLDRLGSGAKIGIS